MKFVKINWQCFLNISFSRYKIFIFKISLKYVTALKSKIFISNVFVYFKNTKSINSTTKILKAIYIKLVFDKHIVLDNFY